LGAPSVTAADETLTIAPPLPPLRHAPDRLLRHQDRAGDVEIDAAADHRRIGVVEPADRAGNAGIIDQMRHGPEIGIDRPEQLDDISLGGHVALHGDGTDAGALAILDDPRCGIGIAEIVDRNVIALARGAAAHGGADAPAAAGHDEDRSGCRHHDLPAVRPRWRQYRS
jgi:hypothetical protein